MVSVGCHFRVEALYDCVGDWVLKIGRRIADVAVPRCAALIRGPERLGLTRKGGVSGFSGFHIAISVISIHISREMR